MHEYDASTWFYLNSLEGRIAAEDLLMAYKREAKERWERQSNLRGYVEFSDNHLEINLQMPVYLNEYRGGNTPHHWKEYEFNGRYNVVR